MTLRLLARWVAGDGPEGFEPFEISRISTVPHSVSLSMNNAEEAKEFKLDAAISLFSSVGIGNPILQCIMIGYCG